MASSIPPELLKSLEAVTLMLDNVLSDTKEHATSLAILKTKLEDLGGNVETLSHILRDGNGQGSLITRMALAEKTSEDIEEQLNDLKEEVNTALRDLRLAIEAGPKVTEEELEKQKREKSIAKWQVIGSALAAFVALGLQLFSMIVIHK
jgi:archaellum component FlaC